MAIFYDTNILLEIARDDSGLERVRKLVNPKLEQEYTSIVAIAELRSISKQNGWGPKKISNLDQQIAKFNILDVEETLVDRYVEIDYFSRKEMKQHASVKKSSREMGKNDLWIAATASLLNMQLMTTDADFDHLGGIYVNLQKVNPEIFRTIKEF